MEHVLATSKLATFREYPEVSRAFYVKNFTVTTN